jgi:regulatory protein
MRSAETMTARSKNDSRADPWATALRLLNRRDYGSIELTRKLQEKAFPPDRIETVVERCKELGYLDDRRYAATRARDLMRRGRAVGSRVLADLKQRGIDEQTACQALAEAREELSERAVLTDLLERRFPGFDFRAASDSERRRVIHFLQRRGFPLNSILQKLNGRDWEDDPPC